MKRVGWLGFGGMLRILFSLLRRDLDVFNVFHTREELPFDLAGQIAAPVIGGRLRI